MRLTSKLIGLVHRAFERSPQRELALRMRYDGTSMTWKIVDGLLTTEVVGGTGAPLSIDLTAYTIGALATLINAQAGYDVPYIDGINGLTGLKATALLDGSGDQDQSNGDHLYAYTSPLWAYFEPVSAALTAAAQQIVEMLRQMVPQTANGEWLDELGAFYAVDRHGGETDPVYANRIITSVVKPTGNNVALEMAINAVTNGLLAKVTDAPAEPFTTPYAGTSYGLFDVVYQIDLSGGDDLNAYAARVVDIVESLRHAGTHMKSVSLQGALADVYDTLATASETMSAINVAFEDFAESAAFKTNTYNGAHTHNAAINHDNTTEDLVITITDDGVTGPPEPI